MKSCLSLKGYFMINIYGLITLVFLMLPNIVYFQKNKENEQKRKLTSAELIEQIGRYGCIIFLLINTGLFEYGFATNAGIAIWIAVTAILMAAYYVFWILLFKKGTNTAYTLTLAVIPSVIFIFSGIMMRRWTVVAFGIIFAAAHIYITYCNGKNNK